MIGYNSDLQSQLEQLSRILEQNEILYDILRKASSIGLQNYYIGGGCITQTVWNYQLGNNLTMGISDIDLIYYDNSDLSFSAENDIINTINRALAPSEIKLDIINQARIHLWYKERFGYDIKPYLSVEDAINSWPTTATSIGVRLENDKLKVYAPFGLNDIFGLIVKANKVQITEEIYLQKVHKWMKTWPSLRVIPWS